MAIIKKEISGKGNNINISVDVIKKTIEDNLIIMGNNIDNKIESVSNLILPFEKKIEFMIMQQKRIITFLEEISATHRAADKTEKEIKAINKKEEVIDAKIIEDVPSIFKDTFDYMNKKKWFPGEMTLEDYQQKFYESYRSAISGKRGKPFSREKCDAVSHEHYKLNTSKSKKQSANNESTTISRLEHKASGINHWSKELNIDKKDIQEFIRSLLEDYESFEPEDIKSYEGINLIKEELGIKVVPKFFIGFLEDVIRNNR